MIMALKWVHENIEAFGGDPFALLRGVEYVGRKHQYKNPGSIKVADAQKEYADTWMYRFEFLPDSAIKNGMLVSHAFELPCVFGVKEHEFSKIFFNGETEESADQIIKDMHTPWINFTKNDAPAPKEWPKFVGADSPVRIFDRITRSELLDRTKLMEVWGDMRFYED